MALRLCQSICPTVFVFNPGGFNCTCFFSLKKATALHNVFHFNVLLYKTIYKIHSGGPLVFMWHFTILQMSFLINAMQFAECQCATESIQIYQLFVAASMRLHVKKGMDKQKNVKISHDRKITYNHARNLNSFYYLCEWGEDFLMWGIYHTTWNVALLLSHQFSTYKKSPLSSFLDLLISKRSIFFSQNTFSHSPKTSKILHFLFKMSYTQLPSCQKQQNYLEESRDFAKRQSNQNLTG